MYIENYEFREWMQKLLDKLDEVGKGVRSLQNNPEVMPGDKLLDNQDMCELLGITKRTLARYRQKKLVAYYMIDGRTYYKSSEVEAFLNQKGKRMPGKVKNQVE